ncbi:hypothetical protein [Pseudorhodoplanes sp.]|uniref:hypothetical protein n=1 Tax=Pseudorhodoplanes sp. TaxID=1934341 RepID=UPI00391D6853
MPELRSLRLVGWAYGGVVAVVAIIALLVVTANIEHGVEAAASAPLVVSSSR